MNDKNWSILQGGSLQVLKAFECNTFDAIICDPPYASGGRTQAEKTKSTTSKYSSMGDNAPPAFDGDAKDQRSWTDWAAGVAHGMPPHLKARRARGRVHRLAAAPEPHRRHAMGGMDMAGYRLDPFCGSGTTILAAVQEGYQATGIEMSVEYAELAKERIEKAVSEGR